MLKKTIVLLLATLMPSASSDIVRPCFLHDYKCIRDNLQANSHCRAPGRRSVSGQYTIQEFSFETPCFNASYIDNNLVIRNHNRCRVSEFYFNNSTDTAVLSIDCPNLDLESDRTLIQHASYLEDTTYKYHIRGVYPLVRLTINLKHADDLDLCSAFVFADVAALPLFNLNPQNTKTANFLSRDLSLLEIYEREMFYYRAPQLALTYINSLICDFGCDQ